MRVCVCVCVCVSECEGGREGCDGGAGADVLPDRDRHGVCVSERERESVCE